MKKVYLSKTMVFAVLYIVVGLAGALGFAEYNPSPDVVSLGLLLTGLLTALLRWFTKESLTLK